MGGRGGSGHAGGGASVPAEFRPSERLANTLNVTLNMASFLRNGIQARYVLETLNGIKAIYDAFPVMKGNVKYVDAEETRDLALASAGGDGGLHMGLYGRMTPAELEAAWKRSIDMEFHPKGTTSASVFVHEMGHQIESYLNRRDYGSAWAWGSTADKVVFQAIQAVDAGITELHSEAAYKLARSISGYAVDGYNRTTHTWSTWETLAEAVSDAYENKEAANPVSREIWKILREKMKR